MRPFPSSMRAAATTPAEPAGACVARYPAAGSLPCISGGSASTLPVSRPARRSLALRPAWSLSRLRGPLPSECFGRYRYLHHPLRLLPAGATVAGRDSHPLGSGAFARRTEKCGLRSRTNEAHPRPGAPPHRALRIHRRGLSAEPVLWSLSRSRRVWRRCQVCIRRRHPGLTMNATARTAHATPMTCQPLRCSPSTIRARITVLAGYSDDRVTAMLRGP